MIKVLMDRQVEMKQELFLIRNHISTKDTVHMKHSEPESPMTTPPPPNESSTPPPKRAQKETKSKTLSNVRIDTPTQEGRNKPNSKILIIGDSISSNVDLKALENATDKKFITAKAYSSQRSTESNIRKKAPHFPKSNFQDVIQEQLAKSDYHSLVLQVGSVDFSNMNTKNTSEEDIEYFKDETVLSAQHLFKAAENALEVKPSLEKVVIMKHIPRYDPLTSDPLSLKPALSQMFNNLLTELWMSSSFKNKIVLGNHNIDCSGAIRDSRYRESRTGRFDGIHLLGNSGRKFYTLSVMNILNLADLTTPEYSYHQTCPQTQHMKRQRDVRVENKRQPEFTLPTHNRFSRLPTVQ